MIVRRHCNVKYSDKISCKGTEEENLIQTLSKQIDLWFGFIGRRIAVISYSMILR